MENRAAHERFLRETIALAIEKMNSGQGGPFGALVVKNGVVVGRGWNAVTSTNDPTAHAEVVAIRDACKQLGSFQLTDCDLYTSCEPCPMCLGAIYWARPRAIYYAADRVDAANAGFDDAFIYEEMARKADERHIPIHRFIGPEGTTAFTAWMKKTDRVEY